jgi:hypothetical protein
VFAGQQNALTHRMTSLALVMLLHGLMLLLQTLTCKSARVLPMPGVMVNPICALDGLLNGFGHPNGLPP